MRKQRIKQLLMLIIVLFILYASGFARGKSEKPERPAIPECKAPELEEFIFKEPVDLAA